MKRRLFIAVALIISILALMYAEYRYIMQNQRISCEENGIIYAEIFGQVDEYYCNE